MIAAKMKRSLPTRRSIILARAGHGKQPRFGLAVHMGRWNALKRLRSCRDVRDAPKPLDLMLTVVFAS